MIKYGQFLPKTPSALVMIRNINPAHGDSVLVGGSNLQDAVTEMALLISACGPGFETSPDDLEEGVDYEILKKG